MISIIFSEKNTVTMQTCVLFIQHVRGVLKKKCVLKHLGHLIQVRRPPRKHECLSRRSFERASTWQSQLA